MTHKFPYQLHLLCDLKEISRLPLILEDIGTITSLEPRQRYHIELVLDELMTNIISYAYPEKKNDGIQLIFDQPQPHMLSIQLIDGGIPFNPLLAAHPNTAATVEERSVGGLGIYFATQFMTKLGYERKDNQNILTLVINLNQNLTDLS